MNKLSLKEKEIIDIFYGEVEENTEEGEQSSSDRNFQHKLTAALNAMDLPDCQPDDIKMKASISHIIGLAYNIKAKRKNRVELIGFVAASLTILMSFCFITISIGVDFFIYIQLAIFFLIPFSLIPIAKNTVNKGGV